MKTIKGKSKEEILDEFDTLISLFKIHISKENKDRVIDDFSLLSKKDDVINIANAISMIIKKADLTEGNLGELVNEIQNNQKELNNAVNLKNYIGNLKQNNINIDILYDKNYKYDNYLNILLNLNEEPEALVFLLGKDEKDCTTLQEAAGDDDNALLNIKDINDFRKCVIFKNKLGYTPRMNDDDFFKAFQENVKESKDIQLYFTRYINIYNDLNKLIQKKFDKSAASKQKIISICENSEFTLINKRHYFFRGHYYEKIKKEEKKKEQKNEKISIRLSAIKELRDRALLTKKGSNEDDENKNSEKYKIFIENVSVIFKIFDLIKEIYSCGYIKQIKVIITLKDYKTNFKVDDFVTLNSEEVIKKLTDISIEFKKKQLIAYRDFPLIRYIYGRQINLIYDKIYNDKDNDILPLLKFISNNSINEEYNVEYKKNDKKDMYWNINSYLKAIFKNIDLEEINENNNKIIKKDGDNDFSGIYCFQALNLQKNVLQLYKYLTKSIPKAQYILFCNKETTSEELTAFLYRALLCKLHSCFIIAGIELLPFKEKITFQSIFKELYENNDKKMKSCLVVAYMNTEADIVKYIHTLKKKFFRNILNDLDNQNMDDVNKNVEIINSDKSGVGKSTHIITKIEKAGKKYIYFPLGGVFTRKDVLNRLKELSHKEGIKNSIIHLDLYDTEKIDLTMEFLFSILITKIYGQNDDIFYLPEEIPIMIEIPNGFIDYMKKFPILDIFKKTTLEIENLAPLIVPKDIKSNVQIVSNYLKYLNEKINILNSQDIYFEGITPSYWKDVSKVEYAKSLSQKECQQLIFDTITKKLKIKYPNYYQITSFINLLGTQLKKFSQVLMFSCQHLNEDERNIYGSKDIRSYIIEKFIYFTKYFIDGGFINLVNNQTRNFRQMSRNFDEDRENEEAIQELAEEGEKKNNLVSFEDLVDTLLLFGENDAEGFDLISNNEKSEDYKRYSLIIKSQQDRINYYKKFSKENQENKNENKNIDENNIKNKDSEQVKFLERLKRVLMINDKTTTFDGGKISDKNEKNLEEDNLEKLQILKNNKNNENKNDYEEEEEEEDEENNSEKQKNKEKSLTEIADNYVFTDDNYFKMALILLRIRAQIPVIMMGETGCGKTSLIRKLAEIYNQGDKTRMKILNIHAGTNDSDIIRFFKKKVIPEAIQLQANDKKKAELRKKKGQLFFETKLWVFLDEINTCKSMGLISEILCKRTFQGNSIPSNIAFIAACNPYRIDKKKLKKKAGLNIINAQKEINDNLKDQKDIDKVKNSSNNKLLVYTVNPLPHSLLNFVFDFGKVSEENEKKYIKSIIKKSQNEFFDKYKSASYNKDDFDKIYDLAIKMIIESQNFIRDKNDVSSVSLREIRRFNIFFEFFCDYLLKKKKFDLKQINISQTEKDNYEFYSRISHKDIQIYSIILSTFVCYYLRIPENHIRKELYEKLKKLLKEYDKNYADFLDIPLKEEKFIAESIALEKGIAKNKALLDNIFALFVTINTKVPIFIVGKPGCSKSLSVQLINKSMRGGASKNYLFKNLPEIIMSCYQGSMGSTSKGVKSVFKKARNILKNIKNQQIQNNEEMQNIISMIYFDEMGLAEHSPNNPLKVIHSELEYDLNEGDKKVAFVGISNWALDASKMNRGLFLSIPDPEREDAKFTSFTIGESYDPTLANTYKSVYESLGDIYYDYKQFLMSQFNNGFEEFHGNRDFYHLVKNVARNLVKENTNSISQNEKNFFIKKGIERNFAGLVFESTNETSLRRIKKYYRYFDDNVEIEDKYDVKDILGQNIEDLKSRYLLVISKPSISEFLLTTILKEKEKEYNYYKGSPFKDDVKSEEYILKILSKIQINMEQEKVLILNNLGTVYPALYDLFNQNFNQVGKKNYARIALGYTTNAYSLVNDNFRCIVNVEDDKIKKEEPPFLNRFEKHMISFENLLDENCLKKSKEIYNILLELTQNNDPEKAFLGINYDLKEIFINLDQEEINAYIYKINKSNKLSKMDYLTDKVIEKLSLLLPQDILLFKKYSGFDKKNPTYSEKIIEEYNKGEHNNFSSFLKKMKDIKNVIYTFSDFFSGISNINNIDNEILGRIKLENITTIAINSFTSENKFEDKLNDSFFNDKSKKLCILKFKSNERHFLNYVKFIIENKEKELNINENEINKAFVFIVYLDRTFNDTKKVKNEEIEEKSKYNETISLTSDFYQIFIDDLNGSSDHTIKDIFNLSRGELIKKWIKYNLIINKNIYETLSYMDYNIECEYQGISKKNYSKKIIKFIQNNKDINEKINKLIVQQMEKDENLISNSLKKKDLVTIYDIDFISCIQIYLSEKYADYFNNFYYNAEKEQFISSLISIEEQKKKNKNQINDLNDEDFEKNKNEEEKENKVNNNKYYQQMIEKVIDIYFDKFLSEKDNKNQKDREEDNRKNMGVIKQLGANKIDIILGLQLPGMFSIISSIVKRSRNDIIKKYLINESNLRKFIIDNDNVRDKEKFDYDKKLKDLNNILFIDLDKNDKIKRIITEKNEFINQEFIDLFLEDYYIIFIYNNLNNYIKSLQKNNVDLSELKKIIKFLVNQNEENLKENKDLETIANIINWVETYSIEIAYILKIYIMIRNYIGKIKKENKEKTIYDLMAEFIKDGKIIYGKHEKCQEYTKRVNKSLFNGFESVLKIITSCKELYIERKGKKEILELLNMNKEILNQMNKFNLNLKLYSKELLTLQEIIEIINGLIIDDKLSIDKLEEIIKYFSESEENNLVENFENFYNYLKKIFEKNKSFYRIISIVFKNEFVKNNSDDEFKKKIIEIIVDENEYILNCNQLLKIILDFEIIPSKIKDNWKNILEDQNILKKINDSCDNEFLEQIIFNIYDFLFMQYFTKTRNLLNEYIKSKTNEDDVKLYIKLVNAIKNKDKNDDTGIIFDLSFEMFGDCVRFLDDINHNEGKNTDLVKLYSISYIKAYLNQLVKFSLDEKALQRMGTIDDIIKLINGKNNGLRKVIKIYIIKLFFNSKKVQRSYNEMNKIDFRRLEYNFVSEMFDDNNNPELDIIKEIIEEKISPKDEKYKEYPYLKYFIYSRDKQSEKVYFIEQFEKNENNIQAYPVIYKFLEEIKTNKLSYLSDLEKYNSFCNFMVDCYSFKITRDEANNKKLKEEDKYKKRNQKKNIYKDFFDTWKKINKYAIKYKSNDLKPPKELNEDDNLIYFLNDVNEVGKGMYIAAGYEFFIKTQNDFLNYFLEHGEDKPYLKFYFENIKNKIPIYEANNNQIVLIHSMFKTSEYKSFPDIVNTYTKRKIFNDDKSINYLNYNELEFDFQGVEEELAKLILPGKCLFADENNLNFINYWGEGFNGGKKDFLQKFEEIFYNPEELTKNEKILINDYIKENIPELDDRKKLYGYVQLLIFYLSENNYKKDQTIIQLIDSSTDIQLDEQDIRGVFEGFKVNKIYSIFLFIEQLCFNLFSQNLIKEYKADIDDNTKNKITDIAKNKKDEIKGLAPAIRRFISRILYRIKDKKELLPNVKLSIELKKQLSLWDKKYRDEKKINKIFEPLEEFNLNIGQSFNLYQIIKEEEEEEFNDAKGEKKIIENNNDNLANNDNKPKNIKKGKRKLKN